MTGRVLVLRVLVLSALALAVLPGLVLGSVGDQSPKFQRCVASCKTDTCRNHKPLPFTDDTIVPSDPLPWYLVLTGWTCETNCEYHCTHRITNEARKRVQDLREQMYDRLNSEQAELRRQHDRWRNQLAQQEAGQSLDPACDGDAYSDADGECVPLMLKPPAPLLSESEVRRQTEERIHAELYFMHPVEKQTVQFFGKWAQLRVLGMQEPFSVLFSLMNLGVQLYAYRYILLDLLPGTFPLKSTYLRHAVIASVAWGASAIFHTRDLWWTERFDYFMAAAVLLSGFFFTLCRVIHAKQGSVLYHRLMVGCIGAWVLHVLYLLSHRRLDYSYNMTACLTVGVLHNLLWLLAAFAPRTVHSFAVLLGGDAQVGAVSGNSKHDEHDHGHARNWRTISPSQQQQLVLLVLVMFCAPGLELFDFPPILRLIDAHALWHLSTVPISLYWYYWLAQDARDCVVTHNWKLDQHAHVTDVDDLLARSHHSKVPDSASHLPLTVEPAAGASEGSSASPATPVPLDEAWGRAQSLLEQWSAWGLDALRALRAMLITQS
ncbi:uncharacterized protein MJAP1_001061 [Malassezia japonica]|uniref:Post-GPI attachment to proteins factor 3 n=1 Tax=Malassezia japonica TaxID=223818 RepID=A0AAF0J9A6_9BASI|nr:uncharacterized protein MJAP1_001061 [Malassezia japonica]WFD38113.1 hypothetical protein MJAP1_001061 [Malassezia japonica]